MKQFKKVLASALALAMVVTAVPTADAQAAAKAPKLNNTKKILYVGQSYTLKVNNLPANWKKCTYAWSASNKNVTVKKGKYGQAAKVTAVKKGTATVTVKMTYPQTAAQKKAKKKTVKTFKCAVTVKNPSVKFTTTADRIEVGETAQFTAKATPSTAKVTYSSSDAAVATVDATGLVTAVADGTATIKASAKVGTKTVSSSKTVEVYTAPTEAKQTKVKEITITSGKVVTKESKIAVKKGSVEVALAEKDGIAIDATGKTVVLTTASKLTKGEYTVTIDDATANFTAEDEKVTDIEFTSDKAVLDAQILELSGVACPANCNTNHAHKKVYRTAKAAYKVYNQFKEDITDATTVSLSGNGVPAAPATKGEIVFTSSATDGFRLNDIVAAVVIYNANGVAVTKSGTFTVTNEAAISEISIKDGLYNKKGEAVTVTEDTDLSKDAAYVLVSAKDQYGRAVTSLTNDDNVYVQLAEGLTNIKFKDNAPTTPVVLDASEEITVDGVKYAGFRLVVKTTTDPITGNPKKQAAGTATVLVISKGTGVTAQGTVTIANGSKIDTLTIQVPDLVVGNESTKLGYTALDTYGKEVTSVSAFNEIKIPTATHSTATAETIYVKENPLTGKAELYYKAASNTNKVANYDVETILTSTYKSTTVQLAIQPDAVPTAITGTKDLTTGSLVSRDYKIKADNIKVVDQYGRADVVKDTTGYTLKASTGTATNDHKAFDAQITPVDIKGYTTDTTLATASSVAGTSKVKFVLADDQGKELSTYEVDYNTVAAADIKTYEVKDLGTVYAGKLVASYAGLWDVDFDVKGVTADGIKVSLNQATNSDFNVTASNTDIDAALANDKLVTVNLDDTDKALKDKETEEISLTFTFNTGEKAGTEIEKKVTLSKATPVVKEAKLTKDKEVLELKDATTNVLTGIKNSGDPLIEAKDQYGKNVIGVVELAPRVTVTDAKLADGTTAIAITNNGKSAAVLDTAWTTNSKATIKLTFPGGYVFTTKTLGIAD